MYIYIHIYIYTCMHTYIHTCTLLHIVCVHPNQARLEQLLAYLYVYIYMYIYIYISTYIYVYIYIYMYIYIHIHIYTCIHTHIHTYTLLHIVCAPPTRLGLSSFLPTTSCRWIRRRRCLRRSCSGYALSRAARATRLRLDHYCSTCGEQYIAVYVCMYI